MALINQEPGYQRPAVYSKRRAFVQPAAKSAFPTTKPPAAGVSPGAPPDQGSPWDQDPILMQIKANADANIATAQARALAARQKSLIDFGYDPNVNYGDEGTKQAAMKNQFSVLANMLRQHSLNQSNINESENKQNLFYSGHRGKVLGQEGTNYLGQQHAAGQGLGDYLTKLSNNLTDYRQGQQGNITGGMNDAYQRWLARQLQYPSTPAPVAVKPVKTAIAAAPSRSTLRTNLLRRRP